MEKKDPSNSGPNEHQEWDIDETEDPKANIPLMFTPHRKFIPNLFNTN